LNNFKDTVIAVISVFQKSGIIKPCDTTIFIQLKYSDNPMCFGRILPFSRVSNYIKVTKSFKSMNTLYYNTVKVYISSFDSIRGVFLKVKIDVLIYDLKFLPCSHHNLILMHVADASYVVCCL
jgi:hypothetical protein